MNSILIIEDDYSLNNSLACVLRLAGYSVNSVFTASEALACLENQSYGLIILDINLPDGNGYQLYPDIRSITDSGIIFLTANDLEADIVKGFDLGADDYITKPFSPVILERKITALFKRLKEKQEESVFHDGYLYLNFTCNQALIQNSSLELTPLEFRILQYMIANQKHIIKREQFFSHLWDADENFVGDTSLNAVISRIRKKIENDSHHYIKTIYGTGYMWLG